MSGKPVPEPYIIAFALGSLLVPTTSDRVREPLQLDGKQIVVPIQIFKKTGEERGDYVMADDKIHQPLGDIDVVMSLIQWCMANKDNIFGCKLRCIFSEELTNLRYNVFKIAYIDERGRAMFLPYILRYHLRSKEFSVKESRL
jgi:hypothetical protein